MSGDFLERAEEYLRCEVAPEAERIDWDPEALGAALDGLCRLDVLALKRPAEFGGPDAGDLGMQHFVEMVARFSGALSFLTTQHQGVVGLISACPNERLKAEYLPKMGNGERLVGVGFSQLRRPGPPITRAEPVDGGYVIEGHVPWVTGLGFFPEFMVAAGLPDGRAVFGIVPLRNEPGVRVSEPMKVAAMQSANTVTVDLERFFVPDERVAVVRDRGWIQHSDEINLVQQGSFALGCARAGLDILLMNAQRRKLDFAFEAHASLDAELTGLRKETDWAREHASEIPVSGRLELRARQIEMAVRCAHAAVASSSGAANSANHPAQRVYREALVYTVSAQTGPIMEATLRRISKA